MVLADAKSLAPSAEQPTKLPVELQAVDPEPAVDPLVSHHTAPSLARTSSSKSMEPESSMAMIRLGSTPLARNSGVSLRLRGPALAPDRQVSRHAAAALR